MNTPVQQESSARQRSITSSESFAARAQRAESTRVAVWMLVLAGMLLLTTMRRLLGGRVMSDDRMFYPYVSVLAVGVVAQAALSIIVGRANRNGSLLPAWVWKVCVAFDMAVAMALMWISGAFSPRGPLIALTSPPMLLVPLVILMSILHLRPRIVLAAGLAGALTHALLAARAIQVTAASFDTVYFAYSFVLALTAVAGTFLASAMRTQVRQAADEAAAHERSERQILAIQQDLAVAREIQSGLLPTRNPQLRGFDITGMNRPADETGGDYYDWQSLADGKLVVVLADVSGHGIGPALVMAVCRAYARATVPVASPDPAALLLRLNELLHEDLPTGRFITLVVAVLAPDGAARLVSAGHGPTLLYRAASGEITQFGGNGIPLGIIARTDYGPTVSLTMNEGDVLVMLTDGYFECMRPDDRQLFGIERLEQVLRSCASGSAATILRTIDESVRAFSEQSPQLDDMTMIVVKRTAPAGEIASASP